MQQRYKKAIELKQYIEYLKDTLKDTKPGDISTVCSIIAEITIKEDELDEIILKNRGFE